MRSVLFKNNDVLRFIDELNDAAVEELLLKISQLYPQRRCDDMILLNKLEELEELVVHVKSDTSIKDLLYLNKEEMRLQVADLALHLKSGKISAQIDSIESTIRNALIQGVEPRICEVRDSLGKLNDLRAVVEHLSDDLKQFTGRTKGSRKGALLEEAVVEYLIENMGDCVVERIGSTRQRGRMDIRIVADQKVTIAVDLKFLSHGKSLAQRDLDKFFKDAQIGQTHAILAVYCGFVPNYRRFHVQVNADGHIIVMLSHLQNGEHDELVRAVEVIRLLTTMTQKHDGVMIDAAKIEEFGTMVDILETQVRDQKMHLSHAMELNQKMAIAQLKTLFRANKM